MAQRKLWGLDISDCQLENADSSLQDNSFTAKLFCSPMEQNPGLPQGCFDIAYSIYAIGWTVDLQGAFDLIASYLEPGGLFIFSWDHPFLHCVDAVVNKQFFSGNYHEPVLHFTRAKIGRRFASQKAETNTSRPKRAIR
jgi:SAM-dependent methyltransferase